MMDIQGVAETAKMCLLENGEFPHCILLEVDPAGIIMVGIDDTGRADKDSYERAYLLFLAGRTFAHKQLKKQRVIGIYEAALAWMAPPGIQPSRHPQRKECLIISVLDVNSLDIKQPTVGYELIRGPGNLIDLLQIGDTDGGETYGAGLPAFFAGIRTAKQHPSLAIHEFRRIFEKFVAFMESNKE